MAGMWPSRVSLDRSPEKLTPEKRIERHESRRVGSRDFSGRRVERHESTRIAGFEPPFTPRHRRFRAEEGWDTCSPILYGELKNRGVREEVQEAEQEAEQESEQKHE